MVNVSINFKLRELTRTFEENFYLLMVIPISEDTSACKFVPHMSMTSTCVCSHIIELQYCQIYVLFELGRQRRYYYKMYYTMRSNKWSGYLMTTLYRLLQRLRQTELDSKIENCCVMSKRRKDWLDYRFAFLLLNQLMEAQKLTSLHIQL